MHRITNVLDKLPKRLHAKAKAALHEVMRAESRKAAEEASARFETDYGPNHLDSASREMEATPSGRSMRFGNDSPPMRCLSMGERHESRFAPPAELAG